MIADELSHPFGGGHGVGGDQSGFAATWIVPGPSARRRSGVRRCCVGRVCGEVVDPLAAVVHRDQLRQPSRRRCPVEVGLYRRPAMAPRWDAALLVGAISKMLWLSLIHISEPTRPYSI